MKRPDSSILQFVQRIPADVLPKARGFTLSIPVGDKTVTRRISDKAKVVKVSLGTRDPSEAKIRQGQVAAYLEGVWRSLRSGPGRLTHKQTMALAGAIYETIVSAVEDDPGKPELWKRVRSVNAEAEAGRYGLAPLLIGEEARERASLEQRFGVFADVELGKRGLVIDQESRLRLLRQIAKALNLAAERLQRNAEGDYSPDDNVVRFPAWDDHGKKRQPKRPQIPAKVKLSELLEAWWKEAKAAGRTISTYNSYRRTLDLFAEFLGHEDASRVTAEDVIAFKDHRLAQVNPRTGKPVSAKTVKESDLTALKSIFGWAVNNRRLASNPAQGITIKLGKRVRTRPPYFTRQEAKAVLSAALHHRKGSQEGAKTAAAKRWIPWLCAYSGARVGEIAQLRKQDVRREDGHWIMIITPEAGTVKTKQAREVPIHLHLIEQGFLTFVERSGSGYLFLDVAEGEGFRGKWQALKNRLREFVRAVVHDPHVQPNHGWRHTFKAIGLDAGIEARVLDAIQGHAPRTEGEDYGGAGYLTTRVKAMERFPRFETG